MDSTVIKLPIAKQSIKSRQEYVYIRPAAVISVCDAPHNSAISLVHIGACDSPFYIGLSTTETLAKLGLNVE